MMALLYAKNRLKINAKIPFELARIVDIDSSE